MNIGVIGIGTMGKNHVRIYSELKGVDNIFVYDISRVKVSLKEDVYICDSIEQLLGNVGAVSICVPTKYHFEVAKKAIEKGVHCLIEKPITSTIYEGEQLLRLFEKKDLIIGVGHTERFNPIVAEIKKILKEPLLIEFTRHNPASSRITDSTIIEDLMIHDIDIVFNVLLQSEGYTLNSMGDNDIRIASLSFPCPIVYLSASRKAKKKIRKIYIEEEDFTIEGDFMNQELYIYQSPLRYELNNERYTQESIIEKILVNKVEPLREELKTFIKCLEENKPFPVTPQQAVNNLRRCGEFLGGGK